MKPLRTLRRIFGNSDRSTQLLAEIREGIANLNQSVQLLRENGEGIANLHGAMTRPKEMPPNPKGELEFRFVRGGSLVGVVPAVGADANKPPVKSVRRPSGAYFAMIDQLLNSITPWSGQVPQGYIVDFLGILKDCSFIWDRTLPSEEHYESTSMPTVESYGEVWFEVASWLMSAHEARGQYVAVSLGAAFGYQLVGAWKALQILNPLPSKLVAVEAVPQNCDWIRRHMTTNGIDPDSHWIIQAALGHDNEPVLFPVGAPGTGLNNSISTNTAQSRRIYSNNVRSLGLSERVLENVFLYNSTGLVRELGHGYGGELKFVSCVTLGDVLSPFERVDLLEVDIQQSEIAVIPPYMDLVTKKVRRVHIATHGRAAHELIQSLFARAGWEVIFDFAPETKHQTERGVMDLSDGIFIAKNSGI